ncbi:MAG: amino acid permease [Gemmatimonadaceae bacterium]|nr:amino acid permease [Gemmatimonadaceae bacterium]
MSLFLRKPVAELTAEAERGVLKRSLGPFNLTALGIGSIIGTGIFVLTGTAASQNAGPALVLSMLVAAVACGFAGLCYAELAAMIPVAGSAYTYAYATVGELIAWIIGWDLILEYALSASTIAVGWSGYAVSLLRDVGIELPAALTAAPGVTVTMASGSVAGGVFNLPAALIVLAVSALLVVGIKESANANAVLVVVKSLVLVVFVAAGVAYVQKANLTPFVPPNTGVFGEFGWSGVLRGAGVIFFAFIGFDAVSTAAQEAKQPQRDMPVAILSSLAICTVLYVAVAIVLTGIVHYSKLNVADPLAVGIDATGLTWLSPFIKVSALFGLFSTMMVQLIGQTRIFFSMSRDGLLPPLFARVHPRFRTPHVSTMLVGVIISIAAGLLPLHLLSQLVSMGTLLAFVLACIGIIVLRKTNPDAPRPFRTPWMPWTPILGALTCLAQMIGLPWATWERLFIWLFIGVVVYWTYGRRHSTLRKRVGA